MRWRRPAPWHPQTRRSTPPPPPIGGSEDFARLLDHVPGNFMFLGNGDSAPLHNPAFDFNDDALLSGVDYFAQLARNRLPVG